MRHLFIMAFLFLLFSFNKADPQVADVMARKVGKINLAGLAITEIQVVPAGDYTIPNGETISKLSVFLRVAFTLMPTSESNIKCEMWIPKTHLSISNITRLYRRRP